MKKNIVKILCATVALSAIGISSVFASNALHVEKTTSEFSKDKKHDLTDVAELLSITTEELEQKLKNGENLYTLLESAGKLDEFKKLQIADFTEKMNQAVADSKMTQDEANEKIAKFTEQINSADSADVFSKKGNHGGKGIGHEKDLTEVASLLGLTDAQLQEKLENGENLYTLLESAGKLDEFKKIQIANFTEKLNQDVTDGKMTQDEANEKIAEFTERINSADSADLFSKKGHHGGKGIGHEKDLTEVASLLGLTDAQLQEKLENGENLYTLLESAGKLNEFKKLQIANFTEKLNQDVTDGKMTQDEANEKIAEFTERINSADSADVFSKKGHHGGKGDKSDRSEPKTNVDAETKATTSA